MGRQEFQSENSKQDSHRLHYLKALKHKHDKSTVIEKCCGKKKAQHNSDESETLEIYDSELKHLKVKNRNHIDSHNLEGHDSLFDLQRQGF